MVGPFSLRNLSDGTRVITLADDQGSLRVKGGAPSTKRAAVELFLLPHVLQSALLRGRLVPPQGPEFDLDHCRIERLLPMLA